MSATIYFSGAISGGREDVALYGEIVEALLAGGYRVLAGAVASETVGAHGEALDAEAIFARDMEWLRDADLIVAEVSKPSLGVGYEVAVARYLYEIPAICLWRPAHARRCSAMIAGDPGIDFLEYESIAEMLPRLVAAIEKYATRKAG